MSETDLHPAVLAPERLLTQCELRLQRRSGPGGQHRNKVETAVFLTHTPSGITAEASERRSQAQNRRMAVFRLRINLALQVRRPADPNSPPSQLWKSRCRGGRIAVSKRHDDFPALLAEALDMLTACEMDVRSAAQSLGCTTSQLTKLLQQSPQAIAQVNEHRRQKGLRPLR